MSEVVGANDRRSIPALVRFQAKVQIDPQTGCWAWTGAKVSTGYGSFRVKTKRHQLAHRFAYEQFRGPIPDGKMIDHLCRNRGCVNPAHLEPVTNQENCIRGTGPELTSNRHREKLYCVRGHPLFGENMRRDMKGHRVCRECMRLHSRAFKAKKRARAAA